MGWEGGHTGVCAAPFLSVDFLAERRKFCKRICCNFLRISGTGISLNSLHKLCCVVLIGLATTWLGLLGSYDPHVSSHCLLAAELFKDIPCAMAKLQSKELAKMRTVAVGACLHIIA